MARASLGSAVWTLEADSTPLARALRQSEALVETSAARIDHAFRRINSATRSTASTFGGLRDAARQTSGAFRVLSEVASLTNIMWVHTIRNAGELVIALARVATESKSVAIASRTMAAAQAEQFVTPAFQSLLYAPFDPTTLKHGPGGRFAKGTGAGPGRNFGSRQQMKVLEELAAMERNAPKFETTKATLYGTVIGWVTTKLTAASGALRVFVGSLGLAAAVFAGAYYASRWYIDGLGGIADMTKKATEQTEAMTKRLEQRDQSMRKTMRSQLKNEQDRLKQLDEEAYQLDRRIERSRSERGGPETLFQQSQIPDVERERDKTFGRMREVEAQIGHLEQQLVHVWSPDTRNSMSAALAGFRDEYTKLVDQLPRFDALIEEELANVNTKVAEADRKLIEQRLAMHNDYLRAVRGADEDALKRAEDAQKALDDVHRGRMDALAAGRTAPPSGEATATIRRLTSGLVSARAYAGISGAIGSGTPEDKQLSEQKRTNALLMQLVRQRGGLRN